MSATTGGTRHKLIRLAVD